MEAKKKSRWGKNALIIGITSGFAFLIALFAIIEGDLEKSETLAMVGLCATSISMFLLAMDEKKTKTCSKV
ncbi:MAG: hypothetical protein ACK5RG_11085 [Cyclobacteriaceae bacterium]|nr:hypothetical protein [Flammeovirgaceae bacterium]